MQPITWQVIDVSFLSDHTNFAGFIPPKAIFAELFLED